MKHAMFFLMAALIFVTMPASAAVPHMINYQGYLTDDLGDPVTTPQDMTFTLYNGPDPGDTQLWTEDQLLVDVQEGLFNVLLGSATQIPEGTFDYTEVWLGITVDTDAEMIPRTRVVSVAYAYRVDAVHGATGGTITGDVNIIGKANIGSGTTNTGTYAFVVGENSTASGNYAAASGGYSNDATGYSATVGGGFGSNADGDYATVSGGRYNDASLDYATISGGYGNDAGYMATVGGGTTNEASGSHSMVGGGQYNRARGDWSVIAGGGGADQIDSNSARGDYSVIGGGRRNIADTAYVTVSGGYHNTADGFTATIGGGYYNKTNGSRATVAGGRGNEALADYAAIGGGRLNHATNDHAYVGGGYSNEANGLRATVSGGHDNIAQFDYTTVSGGYLNTADTTYATVGGGSSNTAIGEYSTVGGGADNFAEYHCAVGGGKNNDAGRGYATIGGGLDNYAWNLYATIPGGRNNSAVGDYAFAAGRRAKANHDGCFVWGDATNADITTSNVNQIRMRGAGGTIIYSNAAMTTGVSLAAGGGSWSTISDSTKKQNIRLINTEEILDKVAQLPIKQWSYKSQDPSVEHIGPMAQDFYKLFHLGEDSLGISTIDPDGIALAAIQELHKKNHQLEVENEAIKAELKQLKMLVEDLIASRNQKGIEQATYVNKNITH